ncbi:hypothetical protein ABVT39_017766 [Epinephelus coioides]
MDLLRPILDGLRALCTCISESTTTTTAADNGGVVSNRRLDNVTGSSLNMRVETVSGAGNPPSGNPVEENSQAVLTACDGSVVCTDRITNSKFKGDMDLSISVKPSQGQ